MADSQADEVKSQIIMKVDSPADEPEDEEKEDNELEDITPNKICSPLAKPVIAPSRFGRALIRPSQFGQPSKFNNFNFTPRKFNPFTKVSEGNGVEKVANSNSTNGETPKFVPLLQTEKSNDVKPTNSIAQSQRNHSFVFGQNLKERVLTDDSEEPQPSTSVSTNGTQSDDMMFSSVMKDAPVLENSTPSKTLSESAREYEELRANKRKYEEVEVKTGEEDETNVLHISCKLFAFDKTVGNWQERGRGNLRLNDLQIREEDESTYTQSRLVFRSAGVLKVVLNTKIWAEMTIEQASAKSIRFTALDSSGEIKVFLVMANPEEAKMLFKSLQERLGSEQRRQNLKKSNTSDEADEVQPSDSG